jgi:hypothetical protein
MLRFSLRGLFLAFTSAAMAQSSDSPHYYVPDANTAVSIAHAVLIPIYGLKTVQQEEPFKAMRRGDDWYVNGTLHCPIFRTCLGGTASVVLSAKDGRILSVIHMK